MAFSPGQRFTVSGRLDGRSVSISYDDGRLSGDGGAVARVSGVLAREASLRLSPQDEEHDATVEDPVAVMAAIQQVLDIDAVEGDYPIPEADDSAS